MTSRKERIKASVIAPGEDMTMNSSTTPHADQHQQQNASTTNSPSFIAAGNNNNSAPTPQNQSIVSFSGASGSISMNEEYMRRRSLDLDEKRSKEWLEYQRLYRQETSSHPKVFFDLIFAADGTNNSQRLVIELFSDVCPKTCENFRELCLGHGGWIEIEKNSSTTTNNNNNNMVATTTVKVDFADTRCNRILPGIGALFGEIQSPLMTNSLSANAASGSGYLPDENFALRHNARGIVTMVGHGPNTIGSQFMILFDRAPQLDFKYVPFGRVIEGLPVLDRLEKQSVTITNIPTQPVVVSLSGALNGKKPHAMTPAQGAPFVAASGRVSSSMMMNSTMSKSGRSPSNNNNNNQTGSTEDQTNNRRSTSQERS